MNRIKTSISSEKVLHFFFQIGVFFKGLDGFIETVGGILFLCVSGGTLMRLLFSLTPRKLLEDPDDWIARHLRQGFAHLSSGAKLFVGAYLLGHGVIKLLLVAGLWRGKLWVFPLALIVLCAFIGYQVIRMSRHPSLGLGLVTLLDVIIVALIWHEYRVKKEQPG